MEGILRVLQDLVALTLAALGIGAGIMTAAGNVQMFHKLPIRVLASALLLTAGMWILYTGIFHVVAG